MASAAEDLDPSEFVERIRKLGEERDQQDTERLRKLEEEILQGRSERAARRAERQRSISPEKSTTPLSFRSSRNTQLSSREKSTSNQDSTMFTSALSAPRNDALQRTAGSNSETADVHADQRPTPAALLAKPATDSTETIEPTKLSNPSPSAGLHRSGTLSWNQRPASGAGNVRRPLSVVAAENSAAKSPIQDLSIADDNTPSRNEIAQSLSAKDPSWFKQTADRGIGSAAYRKNQVEDQDTVDVTRTSQDSSDYRPRSIGSPSLGGRRQLPGLSRESTAEPENAASPPPESFRSSSPSQSSVRGSTAWSNRVSTNTSVSAMSPQSKSPLPILDSQRFAVPSSEKDDKEQSETGRTYAFSPAQGRISPERMDRPVSPTKGFGGFVQSAMLKRSDSQNKRWSVQTGTGLNRTNSTASNGSRAGSVLGTKSTPSFDARPSSLSRENSLEPGSRPSSSHSNMTVTQDAEKKTDHDGFTKPAIPYHSRARSIASIPGDDQVSDTSPPSPSKRWSPTKSSWLESALKKPDAPKVKPTAPVQQPSWIAEINKVKAQREGADSTKAEIGRAEPTISSSSKPLTLRGKPPVLEDVAVKKDSGLEIKESTPISAPAPKAKPTRLSSGTYATPKAVESDKHLQQHTAKPEPAPSSKPPQSEVPPKTDFRATLRSRQKSTDGSKTEEPEFKAAFGKLKRAETKNYVAPDTLKENILRGKGELAVTGGPRPYVKKDEFRDSLHQKKSEMKDEVSRSGSLLGKKAEALPQAVPEALARKKTLSQKSIDISKFQKEKLAEPKPEALARQASLKDKPKTTPPNKEEQSPVVDEPQQPAFTTRSSKLADRFNPALAGMLARGPSPLKDGRKDDPTQSSTTENKSLAVHSATAAPAKELTHMTKGRARGPKRRAPASKAAEPLAQKVAPQEIEPKPILARENAVEAEEQRTLPARSENDIKRVNAVRTTKPATFDAVSGSKELIIPESAPIVNSGRTSPSKSVLDRFSKSLEANKTAALRTTHHEETKAEEAGRISPTKVAFNRFSMRDKAPQTTELERDAPQTNIKPFSPKIEPQRKASPIISPKPASIKSLQPSLDSSVTTSDRRSSPIISPKPASIISPRPASIKSPRFSQDSPNTPAGKRLPSEEQAVDDLSNVSVRSSASLWGRQSASSSPSLSRAKEPIKLPTKADEQAAMEDAGLIRSEEKGSIGLGLGGFTALKDSNQTKVSTSQSPSVTFPVSPPLSIESKPASMKTSPTTISFQGASTEPAHIFAGRFDIPPDTSGELPSNIDTQNILSASPVAFKNIKTLRNQIWEITADGNLSHIPIQQENILFEESMYIAAHLHSVEKAPPSTEIFLWIGVSVLESNIDDVQPFVRKFVREHGAKDLTIVRQGLEPPEFIQSLDILVTRRSTREYASANYMLCGRRHFGHHVFDEVGFSLRSLCSGFAFIVCPSSSRNGGPIYLWKGIGSTHEEVSAARLTIGMNLSPSCSQPIEITEGEETSEFFACFPDQMKKLSRSADFWRYKAGCERYRVRLFRVEQKENKNEPTPGLYGQLSGFLSPTKLLGRRPSWQNFRLAMSGAESPTTGSPTSSPPPKTAGLTNFMSSEKPGNGSNPPTPTSNQPSSLLSPKTTITTSITEISPFTQASLSASHVSILDAFFEIYILPGPLSQSQSHAFSTALLFAQDYALLAASHDDRPFIPVSTVVLDGVPRDLKSVFRRWDDKVEVGGTEGLMKGVRRGKSLRVVGLGRALRETGGR